jgi:hypothetical protein
VQKTTLSTDRTGCHARICANLWDDGTWYLSKVVLEHNNLVSLRKIRFHRCYSNINNDAKKRGGGGVENVPFVERDC